MSGILKLRITFIVDSKDKFVGCIDFDYSKLINGQKFTDSYHFILSYGTIFYQSKLQIIVALSSYKAKYIVTTEARKKVL